MNLCVDNFDMDNQSVFLEGQKAGYYHLSWVDILAVGIIILHRHIATSTIEEIDQHQLSSMSPHRYLVMLYYTNSIVAHADDESILGG